ncbi:MAG TPA: tetratricopeptide repeat protein [Thermoanaerobaculia bacterium]|nr:tetratricopeptide repeat protein [Thermoanaerobaculia bacterium]
MLSWRSLAPSLLGLALAGAAACALEEPPTFRFDAAAIRASRAALERLPAALRDFEAGRYGLAEEAFAALLAELPAHQHAATAAPVLGLGGSAAYRRLISGLETNLGLCRLRSRRYLEALPPLERATESDPGSAQAWANLGVGLLHARRPCEARTALERAQERGGAPRTELHLGRAAFECGDLAAARIAVSPLLRSSTRPDTRFPGADRREAELLLAQVEAEEGDLAAARGRLEALVDQAPDDPLPRYRLIQVLSRLGEHERASAHRQRFARSAALMATIQGALGESPEQVEGLHWIAQTYTDLGLDHLAEVHYRQLIARDPSDREARRGLAELERRNPYGRSP